MEEKLKTYKIIIKPTTGFGSHIKADTLFGHICWQIFYDAKILGKSLNELLIDYDNNPFIVVSSAYPLIEGKIYLKRPSLPLSRLFSIPEEEFIRRRKEIKAKNYFVFEIPLAPLNELNYEKIYFSVEDSQTRCSIDRIKGSTTEAPFTPYVVDKIYYTCDLVIFVGLRQDIEIDPFCKLLHRLGKQGYGKDSSVGYGKFEVLSYEEINLLEATKNPNALYTLGPLCPMEEETLDIYFSPFVRFGRHGDIRSKSKNPFKNPVIFADEAAVVIPKTMPKKPYIGKAVKNLSKTNPDTVCQGYSLIIPVEVKNAL